MKPTKQNAESSDPAAGLSDALLRDATDSCGHLLPLHGPLGPKPSEGDGIGQPGEFPFTRGVHPTMYRSRLWTMRQYAGFSTAELTNARYKYLLNQGQTGLSVAFDLPTQLGYDSDHPIAQGEVGRVGVAIDSLADFEVLMADIPAKDISLSMTINATAPILLALFISASEAQGVSRAQLRGTIQNDILKEYIARGTYIYPVEPSLRLAADIIDFCSAEMPHFNPISISGYHIREAGSTAVQEIAFTLANGLIYCQSAVDRGLAIDDFAPRLSFFFAAHNHLLEEVAKFRAARRLWARLIRDRFGPKLAKSMQLRFHAQTAGSTLVAQQPHNNIVRVALQAAAAVLGGAQSLHTNSWDEALALPSEEAVRIALRTQQILAHESGIADTVDPMGGSFCIESLTDSLEAEAMAIIEVVDDLGGMVGAINDDFVQQQIEDAAYTTQKEIDSGARVVVGSNKFQVDSDESIPTVAIQSEVREHQVGRLAEVRNKRDNVVVRKALGAVGEAARAGNNLMPPTIAAVKAYATVGEISDILRERFGTYIPQCGIK